MATASACKRKVLTIEEKINVLKLSEQGKSCREIARNLSVGKTQVQSIIKNKETLKTLWKKGVHAGRKIVNRRCLYPDLNEKLYEWFEATRSENNPITGRLLQEKAILLSNELGYDNFAASNGWLHSFQTRHNIKCAGAACVEEKRNIESGCVGKKRNIESASKAEKRNIESMCIEEKTNFESAYLDEKRDFESICIREKKKVESISIEKKRNTQSNLAAFIRKKKNMESACIQEKKNTESVCIKEKNMESACIREKNKIKSACIGKKRSIQSACASKERNTESACVGDKRNIEASGVLHHGSIISILYALYKCRYLLKELKASNTTICYQCLDNLKSIRKCHCIKHHHREESNCPDSDTASNSGEDIVDPDTGDMEVYIDTDNVEVEGEGTNMMSFSIEGEYQNDGAEFPPEQFTESSLEEKPLSILVQVKEEPIDDDVGENTNTIVDQSQENNPVGQSGDSNPVPIGLITNLHTIGLPDQTTDVTHDNDNAQTSIIQERNVCVSTPVTLQPSNTLSDTGIHDEMVNSSDGPGISVQQRQASETNQAVPLPATLQHETYTQQPQAAVPGVGPSQPPGTLVGAKLLNSVARNALFNQESSNVRPSQDVLNQLSDSQSGTQPFVVQMSPPVPISIVKSKSKNELLSQPHTAHLTMNNANTSEAEKVNQGKEEVQDVYKPDVIFERLPKEEPVDTSPTVISICGEKARQKEENMETCSSDNEVDIRGDDEDSDTEVESESYQPSTDCHLKEFGTSSSNHVDQASQTCHINPKATITLTKKASHDNSIQSSEMSLEDKEREKNYGSIPSEEPTCNTKCSLNIIQNWSVNKNGKKIDFRTIPARSLADLLKSFYSSARPRNRKEENHREILRNIRTSLNRHLKDIGRNVDIVNDPEFKNVNKIFDKLVLQKVSPEIILLQRKTISRNDLALIRRYFEDAIDGPVGLRYYVWFSVVFHFVTPLGDTYLQLTPKSFLFQKDDHGEFVVIDETKHKSIHEWTQKSTKKRVMYATGGRLCPVRMLRLLIEKSEPECAKLFNQFNSDAIHNPQNRKYWFVAKPIVMSSTKIFMPNICKLAKTKTRYTNHCLSVTALHCYENADKEVKSIMFH